MVGLNVLGLSFSNYTLKYVDASFYQIARGLVLPFTVLISTYSSSLSLSSHPSPRPSLPILLACTLVTLGFFTGVLLDGTALSLVGISFGVASSLITATHSVVIKQSLGVVGGSALALSWYTNALSAVVLAPLLVLAGEGGGVVRLLFGEPERVTADRLSPLATFLWGSAITGVLGFMMSIASLLSIKVTSPITHMVSSAVRGVAASLLGVWLFHDIITTGRASSIAIILLGSIFYTWVKHQESQAASNGNSSKPSTTSRRGSREYERLKMDDVEAGIREKEKQ
ncbi:hypothetical protein CVT26_006315 [Gymnopilus dilepis]|uniref:GDP-mannose transporter n=1 Tax=Gymnopilus dilepis TaxID=231916 RepID=A0A409W624_9AGAR|nr:hypothetical protein CVT26_006315 [Gymnopilus dilepis]